MFSSIIINIHLPEKQNCTSYIVLFYLFCLDNYLPMVYEHPTDRLFFLFSFYANYIWFYFVEKNDLAEYLKE